MTCDIHRRQHGWHNFIEPGRFDAYGDISRVASLYDRDMPSFVHVGKQQRWLALRLELGTRAHAALIRENGR